MNLLAIEFVIQDTDMLFRKPESHGLSKREGSPTMDRSCTKASFVQLNARGGGILVLRFK